MMTMDEGCAHLKEKCDADADFITTQTLRDVRMFLGFKRKYCDLGITIPILPWILP
jgi:methylenetetrahydrofolate reductase (NADPH)